MPLLQQEKLNLVFHRRRHYSSISSRAWLMMWKITFCSTTPCASCAPGPFACSEISSPAWVSEPNGTVASW